MTLSLDAITLSVDNAEPAQRFYEAVFSPNVVGTTPLVRLNMHGSGQLELAGAESAGDGEFQGCVVSYVVSQPTEVEALLAAAAHNGAETLKAAKKGFFGGFSTVFRAPDGCVWKVSAPSKKDTGPAAQPPVPTETAALLGVSNVEASAAFYASLGLTIDRNYGRKYVDFLPSPGACRLGLLPDKDLAKDAGLPEGGMPTGRTRLSRYAASPGEVDALLAAADSGGGRAVTPAQEKEDGTYTGEFTDPDGYLWRVMHEG